MGRPHRYRDKYQLLKDEGKLHGTITAARALRRVRDSRHVVQDNIAHRRALFDACLGVAIPFGVVTTEYVTLTVTGEHPTEVDDKHSDACSEYDTTIVADFVQGATLA